MEEEKKEEKKKLEPSQFSDAGRRFFNRLKNGGLESINILKTLMEEQPELFTEEGDFDRKNPDITAKIFRDYDEKDINQGIVMTRKITRREAEQESGFYRKKYNNLRRAFEAAIRYNSRPEDGTEMVILETGKGEDREYTNTVITADNFAWKPKQKKEDDK